MAEDVDGNTSKMLEPVVVTVTVANALPKTTGLKASGQAGNLLLLVWDKAQAIDTAGYKVYYGTSRDKLDTVIDAGNFLSLQLSGFNTCNMYYFAVSYYDVNGKESVKSDIIAFKLGIDGDVDGNGIVDLADAISAIKIISSGTSAPTCAAANTTGDGKIGLPEAIYILQKVAGLR